MANKKTTEPKGLTIKRNKGNYVASWKIGDKDYGDGQSFQYATKSGTKWSKWHSVTIGKTTTQKTVNLPIADYWPEPQKPYLKAVAIRVKGNRKSYTTGTGKKKKTINPTASDWTKEIYNLSAPNQPGSITVTPSDALSNQCTFSWETSTSDSAKAVFNDVQYQSMLVKASNVTDGSKLTWSSSKTGYMAGTKGANSSLTISEDTSRLASDSWTRWIRIRSRGPAGASAWRYGKHVYALPYQAKITSASAKTVAAGGYLCTVRWESAAPASHPIDSTTIQYAFATPDAGLACPDSASWTDAKTTTDTAGADGASFSIDSVVGYDQCLFVRVNNTHDKDITYGLPKLVDVGPLTAPENLSITNPDAETHRATVNADNQSAVLDSFLVVLYCDASNPSGFPVGIIPHGSSSVTVQCPAWTGSPSFAVYAAVGSYTPTTRADGVTSYAVTARMKSAKLSVGGAVPAAPTNVNVVATDIAGTIQVTFDWAWETADAAELSWADHSDAWESTDEPETYEIHNTHASRWNISGLETGTTWYVRVRLKSGDGDNATYGAYSDIYPIDLTSAPAIPVMELSASVITQDGDVTASWVYVSTDGTPQAGANIVDIADPTSSAEYVLTTDTHVKANKTYYAKDGNNYNQVNLGEYTASADTSVVDGKIYYTRTGAGTDADPYVYTRVLSPTGNPSTLGYYEFTGDYTSPAGYYVKNYNIIASTETTQSVTINAVTAGWETGETHYLAVTVVSASGKASQGYSDPVTVDVAEPLVCTIAQTSLVEQTITVDEDTRTINALTVMPLTITVTGALAGGNTTVIIERAENYHLTRPDETDYNGFAGETICVMEQTGEAEMTITQDDLIGPLDDEASYRIIATVQDGLGQSSQATIDFEVHWSHQAVMPEADVIIDDENLVAFLTPIAPDGWAQGDTCDIYRLSVDRPVLIYPNAVFGEKYVDPFPTIGEHGGHRFVYRTINGDFITADNHLAILDMDEDEGDRLDSALNVIDFGQNRVTFQYNVDLSASWKKDFQETKYLGGSVQGDWNPGVSRTGSVSTCVVASQDQAVIEAMRRLAVWPGICHVRTKDGSSYAADVQVSESRKHDKGQRIVDFSLSITRVDPEDYDGLTYAEWMETQEG